MLAQYRPDIARVAEETVANLRGLENVLEVLRNDIAWLCNSIGHPEAARLALTPLRALNPYGQLPTAAYGASPFGPAIAPQVQTPFGVPGAFTAFGLAPAFAAQGISPFLGGAFQAGSLPLGATTTAHFSPFLR